MQPDPTSFRQWRPRDLMDIFLRLGLIILLTVLCVRIFEPFLDLMLWALILAVALYPFHGYLAQRFGGHQMLAASLIVFLLFLLIVLPSGLLGVSFAEHIQQLQSTLKQEEFTIRQPPASVAGWPFIGQELHSAWSAAAQDLPALLKKMHAQLLVLVKFLLALVANMAGGLLQFLGSLIIAGIMMVYGQEGNQVMQRIAGRIAGAEKGARLHALSTATIRSVATGVIGVAFIQALLLGIGFIWAGIPGAGVLAFLVLIFGIAQLPASVISLPAILYIWWVGDSTLANILFTLYLLIAGMADNVLKPLLLGRGVDAPMPVILLGALGGLIGGGIIGLFVGAVLLAVGYQIFMAWVYEGEYPEGGEAADPPPSAVPEPPAVTAEPAVEGEAAGRD